MKRARRTVAATAVTLPPAVAHPPDPDGLHLSLDFTDEKAKPNALPKTRGGSIKESIIRWLDQEL